MTAAFPGIEHVQVVDPLKELEDCFPADKWLGRDENSENKIYKRKHQKYYHDHIFYTRCV